MARDCTQIHASALFGSTDYAGGVPDDGSRADDGPGDARERRGRLSELLSPAAGPVYLEGRLVLSHSFQPVGEQAAWLNSMAEHLSLCGSGGDGRGEPLERYRIWDDEDGAWLSGGPTVLRFENADVVERDADGPIPVWIGAVDTRRRVITVPDLDRAGIIANRDRSLRWKRC